MSPSRLTAVARLYQLVTGLAAPLARRAAARRMAETNGPLDRLPERDGRASRIRPSGRLVWVHAVSVGEFQSILGLVQDLCQADTTVLVTTTTATAASLAADRLPDGALHQFSPLDTPGAVRRFLDHWRPDLVVFVESEIWPNQIFQTHKRGIPLALINARLSAKSMRQWHKFPRTARALFTRFDRILCQLPETTEALVALGAPADRTSTSGDMKAASAPLPFDAGTARDLTVALGDRPVWVAASSHPDEEEIFAAAHQIVLSQHPDALLILVPRHPERGAAIAAMLKAGNWQISRRNTDVIPTQNIQIYLADTMGETGLWYHLAPIVCVAGSFVPVGGHNPYEPAHFNCAILHGPLFANFTLAYSELAAQDACLETEDATALGLTVAGLFQSPRLGTLQKNAKAYVDTAQNRREEVAGTLRNLML